MTDDTLDRLLTPTAPPGDERLQRERHYRATLPALRSRRRWRFVPVAAGFAAGIACGVAVTVGTPPPQSVTVTERTVTPPPVTAARSASDLEWQALDAPEPTTAAFVQAGDRYLRAENDVDAALRCYRRALRLVTDRELEASAGDTWLWMSLKDAKRQERSHDRRAG